MKIEMINENQIKCTLTNEDLRERKISLGELAYGSDKAKKLFSELVQRANEQYGFESGDGIPLMIEAIPSQQNLVMIITKVDNPDEMDIVDEVNNYINYIKDKNLSQLDSNELINEFKRFNDLYIKSFIAGMTRPEDYLTKRLEEGLISQNYNRQDIDNIFAKISTCPNEIPLSYSEEPLDLLIQVYYFVYQYSCYN